MTEVAQIKIFVTMHDDVYDDLPYERRVSTTSFVVDELIGPALAFIEKEAKTLNALGVDVQIECGGLV